MPPPDDDPPPLPSPALDTWRLAPGTALVWRDTETLQVGLDPHHAVALQGVTAGLPDLLTRLGSATPGDVAVEARSCGMGDELTRALHLLGEAGMLVPAQARVRRDDAWVNVVGAGHLARQAVLALRRAEVGRVEPSDSVASRDADVIVVAADNGRGHEAADVLLASGVPHVWACVRDGRALVGPFVLPGATSCLRCHDMHRLDSDAAWPTLAASWESTAVQPACEPDPETVALAAATIAQQVTSWMAGSNPATLDGTLEQQPDGQVLRRAWSQHPACGCGWGG